MVYADETKKLNWLFAVKQIKNNDELPDSDYQKYLFDAKQLEVKSSEVIRKNGLRPDVAIQIYSDFNADVFLLMQEVARGSMSNDAGKSAFDKINRKYDDRLISELNRIVEEAT